MKVKKANLNAIKELNVAECELVTGGQKEISMLNTVQITQCSHFDGHQLKRPKKPVKH